MGEGSSHETTVKTGITRKKKGGAKKEKKHKGEDTSWSGPRLGRNNLDILGVTR